MPFGAQRTDLQHYYYEQFLSVGLNIQIAQGGAANASITSWSMPWLGDVLVDGWVNFLYDTGATILNAEVWPAANIGPSNYWVGKRTETDAYGGWLSVPFFGRWASLAAGTYFDFGIQMKCGAVNGRCLANMFSGSFRAQAI